MKDSDMIDICREAIETYGAEKQIIIAIEECSELQKALTKWLRLMLERNIREEMGDVEIMMCQLVLLFGGYLDDMKAKLERLKVQIIADTGGET